MKPRHLSLLSLLAVFGIAWWLAMEFLLPPGVTPWRHESAALQSSQGSPQISTSMLPKGLVTLRVDLRSQRAPSGQGDRGGRVATSWDGSLEVSRGRLSRLRFWKADPRDSIDDRRWTLTTRRTIPWNRQQRQRGHEAMPLQDGALLVELLDTTPATRLEFDTNQGKFDFALADVPFGSSRSFLRGLARVSRTASAVTCLSAPTEDGYPSAALGSDGKLYVAYAAFTHGKDFRRRPPITEPPKSLDYLAQPTGGDQVLLLTLDGDRWTGPQPVSDPGQEIYRTALAVDGGGSVWVFWSAKRGDNWDLYARRRENGRWARELRLSTSPGADTFPAATTDSSGRVWVAWQAFGKDNSDIVARRQENDRFGEPLVVTANEGNEWAPAIAAAPDGRVAITWDTYAKGDYDVYCRVWANGKLGAPIPIAASRRSETRPSITYDAAGRLWIAYEDSPENWGKDWGALEQTGVPLYRQRRISVRVWHGRRLWRPVGDPTEVFYPSPPGGGRNQRRRALAARLALPRLTTDAVGRVWLAVRSPRLGSRVGVGTTWFEHAAWYAGDRWSGEVVCPQTDGVLDSRPAIVAKPSGTLVLVTAADGRYRTASRLPRWFIRELRRKGQKVAQPNLESRWPDPVNSELAMAEFGPAPGSLAADVRLEPVDGDAVAPSDEASREAADVKHARSVRVSIGGKTLRLWRGEFHRHTELSQDGGGDGLLMDMWRYALDAARLDWIGNGDHDNGNGREYSWWITQKTTDLFHMPGAFTPMFSYERSVSYPDGHRNVVFARRGIRPLPRLQGGMGKDLDEMGADAPRPPSPDTQLLYRYLAHFDGVCASHTSGTDMGTDWRDNDPAVEPIVEIYQGCRQNYEMPGAPRSNSADHSIGGWRPFGFVSLALEKGYRLGFQASSDHTSTHISYCNLWVESPTREGILAAMKARRVYGATDNIIADVRCGEHFMGEEFSQKTRPELRIHLIGTRPFATVHVVKDGKYVYTTEPGKQDLELSWSDFDATPGTTSYYYVRGEQEDGELVWVSPMWITYRP